MDEGCATGGATAASAAAGIVAAAAAPIASAKGQPVPAPPGPLPLESLGHGPGSAPSTLQHAAEQLASEVPLVGHMAQVMPAADFIFGGLMLLAIMLIHATGMRMLTNRFESGLQHPGVRRSTWRPDLLLGAVVGSMLLIHLSEIFVWSAALVYSGLVPDWRAAGFFAANTYTTVGYGNFVLPFGWHMLAPIIAISGLFTFGWTGSVLVEVVRGCQAAKKAAVMARATKRQRGGKAAPPG